MESCDFLAARPSHMCAQGRRWWGENYPLLILLNSDRASGDRVLKLSGLLLEKRQYFHHLEAK